MNYKLENIMGTNTHEGKEVEWFDEDNALGILLVEGVLFSNSRRYVEEVSGRDEVQSSTVVLFVSCSDVFYWGTADAESLPYDQIKHLFTCWHNDKIWGVIKWCAIQRNQRPQEPMIKLMKSDGVWDEEMKKLPV